MAVAFTYLEMQPKAKPSATGIFAPASTDTAASNSSADAKLQNTPAVKK